MDSGNVTSECPGTNQVDGISLRGEQLEDARDGHAWSELAVRELHRRVAAAHGIGDRVVIEGERDAQARRVWQRSGRGGHRSLQRATRRPQ